MSAHTWFLVGADDTVRCTITAPDREAAEAILRPVGLQMVVSALSYAFGRLRGKEGAARVCGRCGNASVVGTTTRCRRCTSWNEARSRKAKQEREAAERRRTARQRQREGPIRRGIAQRKRRRACDG